MTNPKDEVFENLEKITPLEEELANAIEKTKVLYGGYFNREKFIDSVEVMHHYFTCRPGSEDQVRAFYAMMSFFKVEKFETRKSDFIFEYIPGSELKKKEWFNERYVGKRFKYYNPFKNENGHYFIFRDDEKVVAMSMVRQNPALSSQLSLTFIEVDEQYREKGLASTLVNHLFAWAEPYYSELFVSKYSEQGNLYLKPVMQRVGRNYSGCLRLVD